MLRWTNVSDLRIATLYKMADEPPSTGKNGKRNGKLAIPLPFEEAVRAALEVKPGERAPKKTSQPKAKKPKAS